MTVTRRNYLRGHTLDRKRPAAQPPRQSYTRRERCEQAIARDGIDGAIQAGWPVEEVRGAYQHMCAAIGDDVEAPEDGWPPEEVDYP